MKTALIALTTAVLTALPGVAGNASNANPSTSGATRPAAGPSSCSHCRHAPCRCGYSPSYYTHYRQPVRRICHSYAPVVPHWTRPRVPVVVTPSPRPPAAVPTRIPRVRLGYDPAVAAAACLDPFRPVPTLARGGDARRGGVVPGRIVRTADPSSPNTLVPTPRRASTVPTIVPKQRLGFVPRGSVSRGVTFRRGFRVGR
jgi:hypothetical protein